jgi:hypothetical protein
MDSDITVKLLDDDGNVQAQRQVSADVLKSKSNTLKEMFNDIPVSEVSIPASELPVKVWDEIESLWTFWDSKEECVSMMGIYIKLATKNLDELVQISNSFEYLDESNEVLASSLALASLDHEIKEDLRKGHEPVLQLLKPRLSRSIVDSILSEFKDYEFIDFSPLDLSLKIIPFNFIAPEHTTISQAVVLWKVMSYRRLQKFKVSDDTFINERDIFESLDDSTKRKVARFYRAYYENWCTIL